MSPCQITEWLNNQVKFLEANYIFTASNVTGTVRVGV